MHHHTSQPQGRTHVTPSDTHYRQTERVREMCESLAWFCLFAHDWSIIVFPNLFCQMYPCSPIRKALEPLHPNLKFASHIILDFLEPNQMRRHSQQNTGLIVFYLKLLFYRFSKAKSKSFQVSTGTTYPWLENTHLPLD